MIAPVRGWAARLGVLAVIGLASGAALAQVPEAGLAGARAGGPLRERIDEGLQWISTGIEVTGVAVIVVGAVAATLLFLHGGLVAVGWPTAFRRYRANLGRGILLGLELLVAADIIGTIAVTPSFQNLAVLGLIVLIRTFLSFSLEVEIEGRWPWQGRAADRNEGAAGPERERL